MSCKAPEMCGCHYCPTSPYNYHYYNYWSRDNFQLCEDYPENDSDLFSSTESVTNFYYEDQSFYEFVTGEGIYRYVCFEEKPVKRKRKSKSVDRGSLSLDVYNNDLSLENYRSREIEEGNRCDSAAPCICPTKGFYLAAQGYMLGDFKDQLSSRQDYQLEIEDKKPLGSPKDASNGEIDQLEYSDNDEDEPDRASRSDIELLECESNHHVLYLKSKKPKNESTDAVKQDLENAIQDSEENLAVDLEESSQLLSVIHSDYDSIEQILKNARESKMTDTEKEIERENKQLEDDSLGNSSIIRILDENIDKKYWEKPKAPPIGRRISYSTDDRGSMRSKGACSRARISTTSQNFDESITPKSPTASTEATTGKPNYMSDDLLSMKSKSACIRSKENTAKRSSGDLITIKSKSESAIPVDTNGKYLSQPHYSINYKSKEPEYLTYNTTADEFMIPEPNAI